MLFKQTIMKIRGFIQMECEISKVEIRFRSKEAELCGNSKSKIKLSVGQKTESVKKIF